MPTVAQVATLAHGYTMSDIDSAAKWALNVDIGSMVLDASDRWETAWHAVVEALYEAQEPPSPYDLMCAGRNALRRAAQLHWKFWGTSSETHEDGVGFGKYWRHIAADDSDWTDRIVERLALPQLLSQISDEQYEAISAVAAHGTQAAAAQALGLTRPQINKLVQAGREIILRAMLEGETPWVFRKFDSAVECRAGHLRADFGYVKDGKRHCYRCDRARGRRVRARGSHRRVTKDVAALAS